MFRIIFMKSQGGIYWAVCKSMTYDELEGYQLDSVRENSRGSGPASQIDIPPDWRVISIEEEYEDTGLSPEQARELTLPNAPLTLDELREMDEEPVWIVSTPDSDGERIAMWVLVSVYDNGEILLMSSIGAIATYDEAWSYIEAIYRRKPEESRP